MPARDTAWPDGTPCWVDYGAADVDAAKTFYTDVLGWTYTGGEEEYGGYLTCESSGRGAAGMAPQTDPSDPPNGRLTSPPVTLKPLLRASMRPGERSLCRPWRSVRWGAC